MYVTNAKPWFTFLVHPRDVPDLYSIRAVSLLRRYSDDDLATLQRITELTDEGVNLAAVARILDLEARNAELEADNAKLEADNAALKSNNA